MVDLHRPLSASFGLVLGLYAHAVGWPLIRGGLGRGRRRPGRRARAPRRDDRDRAGGSRACRAAAARAVILDTTPRAALAIAGDRLPARTRRIYERFRYGSGVFKVDWALDGPIPWRADGLRRTATVHLGGTIGEVAAAERTVPAAGIPSGRSCCASSTARGTSRAPAGKDDGVGVLPRSGRARPST